jgi:hypothetical protein
MAKPETTYQSVVNLFLITTVCGCLHSPNAVAKTAHRYPTNAVRPLAECLILGGDHNINQCQIIRRYYKELPQEEWGTLLPGTYTFNNPCGARPGSLDIIAGHNVISTSKFPFSPFTMYGRSLIVIDKVNDTITVKELHIFDDQGRLIASIHDNKFWILRDPLISHVDKSDKSTLIVYDYKDNTALKLVYINAEALHLDGIFRNDTHIATISESEVNLGGRSHISGDCVFDAAMNLGDSGFDIGSTVHK